MPTYNITVITGTPDWAGTDANVYITLFGENGSSEETLLDNADNNFERDKTDIFSFVMEDLGNLEQIRIRHDNSGSGPGWFLKDVTVENQDTNENWVFPCNRWLATDEDDQQIDRVLDVA